MNNKILPVTHEIREYLKKEPTKREKKILLNNLGFDDNKFDITKKIGKTIITKKGEKIYNKNSINNRLNFLSDIAQKLNKSLIWIYQEMVLDGYAEEISEESDIYQAALLAYKDTEYLLRNSNEQELILFEEYYVLNGTFYNQKLEIQKSLTKKRG